MSQANQYQPSAQGLSSSSDSSDESQLDDWGELQGHNGEEHKIKLKIKQFRRQAKRASTNSLDRDDWNERAAKMILHLNNKDNLIDRLDLHQLYVREAIAAVEQRLTLVSDLECAQLEVITGRGNHSKDQIPKLKPAILEYLMRNGDHIQSQTSGSVTVKLKY